MLSSRVIVSFTFAVSALANVFVTSPVSSTTLTAGQPANLAWMDDGNSPTLEQFGLATFAIYVGNANQQTPLQTLGTAVNVSAMSSLSFTPDGTIGPNSDEYFIRVTSSTLKDPAAPQYFEEAFSAKFTMASMSGSFNSTIQAEINGQSTAPIGGTSAASSPLATSGAPATTSMVATTGTPSSSPATASGTSTPSANGAGKPIVATGVVALAAVLVGASFL